MSNCWYCNNELTTGDNPKHFGICNKCYDEMFKSGDTIIRSLTNKIAELQKQLEEKEKDNQFLKKMYLLERTKNDNYHTEKYGLDKSVEELRKIKLTPKEKEIYYKGFDNCERQFATHIAELQQQLEEKEKELKEIRVENYTIKSYRDFLNNQCKNLIKENKKLNRQLKSQPAEIVEKINGEIYTRMVVVCKETKYTDINLILNNILKEYQK